MFFCFLFFVFFFCKTTNRTPLYLDIYQKKYKVLKMCSELHVLLFFVFCFFFLQNNQPYTTLFRYLSKKVQSVKNVFWTSCSFVFCFLFFFFAVLGTESGLGGSEEVFKGCPTPIEKGSLRNHSPSLPPTPYSLHRENHSWTCPGTYGAWHL